MTKTNQGKRLLVVRECLLSVLLILAFGTVGATTAEAQSADFSCKLQPPDTRDDAVAHFYSRNNILHIDLGAKTATWPVNGASHSSSIVVSENTITWSFDFPRAAGMRSGINRGHAQLVFNRLTGKLKEWGSEYYRGPNGELRRTGAYGVTYACRKTQKLL